MPDITHDGNDPMGAPTSHRGHLENCPAPDCQDRIAEQQDQTALRENIALAMHSELTELPVEIRRQSGLIVPPLTNAALRMLPPPVDRATVLREEAARIRAHCPDHLDSNSADGSWISCHCDVADDMLRRLAAEPNPLCTLCGHLTCQGGKPCGVVSTERGELDQPCPCTGNTPPPLTPCTCRQAIHAREHADRTVPDCPWCMPTPNIRPNRATARTCNEVELPTHTVDEEADRG